METRFKIIYGRIPKIGIALGSGSARGFAHIGVLRALEDANIPIGMIAGTSAGAIVGAFFAKEGSIRPLEKIILKSNWKGLTSFVDPSLTHLKEGLIYGKRIKEILASLIGDIDFKDLEIPFSAVATDIDTGKEVVIKEGNVIEAIRASMSIPALFVPARIGKRFLVDGGLTNPVPVDVVKDMGAEIVIGVDVLADPQKRKTLISRNKRSGDIETPDIFKVMVQSLYIVEHEIVKQRTLKSDIMISPNVSDIEPFGFKRMKLAIKRGYIAAEKILPRLQELIEKYNQKAQKR